MAFKITLNGVDISAHVDECTFTRDAQDRPRCSFRSEGIAIEEDDEVVTYLPDGTTPGFGGLVAAPRAVGWTPQSLATFDQSECVGWERYLEWCSVSLAYTTDVALEDVLEDFVTAVLGDYGITYTPSATGVTLAPFTWVEIGAIDAWRQLQARVPRLLRIGPTKAITATVPGATNTPFQLTDANLRRFARLERGVQAIDRANRVRLRFGPTGVFPTTQRWVANGSDTSWVTDIPATGQPALVMVDDGASPFLATVGSGAMFEWSLTANAPYGTLSVGTYGTPANGVKLVLGPTIAAGDAYETAGFSGVYPFTIQLGSDTPPREYRAHIADVNEYGPALEIATQMLAKLNRTSARVLDIDLDGEDGFDAGQQLAVNTTARGGIVGDFLVGRVDVTVRRGIFSYRFTATEGLDTQPSSVGRLRQALGGSGSSTAVSVVPTGGSGGGVATGGVSVVPLGGLEMFAVAASDWTDVPGMLPHVAQSSFTGRVRVSLRARNSGAGVTARLYDGTTGVESSEVVSTSLTEVEFLAAIVSGERYKLQIKRTTGSGDVYASPGQLERVS